MCDHINQSAGKELSEEDFKNPLKNHNLYKKLLREALKNKGLLSKFVETIWPDKDNRPRILLLCGCYPPILPPDTPVFVPKPIREINCIKNEVHYYDGSVEKLRE